MMHGQIDGRAAVRGFTLVELLVSILISLLIFGGVVNVIVSSNRSFNTEEESSFIQENIRFAIDTLTYDIRHAGFIECGNLSQFRAANSIDNDYNGILSLRPIEGYEGTAITAFPASYNADRYNDSDTVLIRYVDTSSELSVSSHNGASAEIKLHGSHNFVPGTPLMIVDSNCSEVGLFEVSGPNESSLPASKLEHNTGSGTNNCTKVIKATVTPFDCSSTPCNPTSCAGNPAAGYGPGSSVYRMNSFAYYIGESDIIPGMPALKRVSLNSLTATGYMTEELVQGVARMEILYGIDSDIKTNAGSDFWLDDEGDGAVNTYVTANNVVDWNQVLTVKINLYFRSQGDVFDADQTTTLDGYNFGPDRILWRAASTTVQIRSRSRRSLSI